MAFTIFLLLLVPSFCWANDNTYKGWISLQGSKIDFEVSFSIAKNNLVTGTSVTAKGTADETTCRIKGKFSPRNGSISFYETVVLSSKAQRENLNFCLLSAQLNLKETTTSLVYSGFVTGYARGSKVVCARGQIYMERSKPKTVEMTRVTQSKKMIPTDTLYSSLNSKKIIAYQLPGNFFTLSIKDDIKSDGDIVNIYFDGKPVLLNYTLTESLKTIELNTSGQSKKHIIKIGAVNEGTASPNTSRIILNSATETRELTAHIKKGQAVYIEIN